MSYIGDKIEMDQNHKYKTPIGELPSVTTILNVMDAGKSGALVKWAVRETCNFVEAQLPKDEDGWSMGAPVLRDILAKARKEATRQRDTAAGVGKTVHSMVEEWAKAHLQGVPYTVPMDLAMDQQVMFAWDGFYKFAATRGFRPLSSERMLYSRKHKYAGTLDLVAQGMFWRMHKSKAYLIDCKTGTVIEKSHGPQLAAYAQAYEEMTGLDVQGIAVLQLDKLTGGHTWIDLSKARGKHWRVFRAALDLYNELYQPKRPGRRT